MLAPTGTIGFLMDCDTTGIEPDIALVKYKLLAGGGMLKIVNQTVKPALEKLGYNRSERSKALSRTSTSMTRLRMWSFRQRTIAVGRASGLKPEHLPVFDCAFKPFKGKRSLHYLATCA